MTTIPNTGLTTLPQTAPTPTLVNTPAPPTSEQVYSANNITQSATNPVQTPNLSDPYGLYDQFMGSQDIQNAQQSVLNTQNQINASNQALRTTTSALENQNEQARGGTGASINLIGKQVGRARDLTSRELAGLGETLQGQQALLSSLTSDAQNRYNIALRERENLNELIRQTEGDAGIKLTDSYEEALKKAKTWEDKQKEYDKIDNLIAQTSGGAGISRNDSYDLALKKARDWDKAEQKKAEKKAEKDELKAQLRALGKSTSGSRRELKRRLKKALKSSKAYDEKMKELDYKIKQKAYNKPYYKTETSKPVKLDFSNKGLANMIDEEINTGATWQQIAEKLELVQPGITKKGSTADKYLRYAFGVDNINPFE